MKKILVISDHPTHPIVSGNRMCIMQYVEVLQKNNFEVHLLYIHGVSSSVQYRNLTSEFWGDKFHEYKTTKLQYYVQRIATRFKKNGNERYIDLYYPWGLTSYIETLHKEYRFTGIICNYVWMSKAMYCSIPHKVLYTHDVFSNRNIRVKGAEWLSFPVSEEQKALNRCPVIFSIQDEESAYYHYLVPKSKVVTVYSSFPLTEHLLTLNKNILFFSSGQLLNLNAFHYFMNEVLPLLVEQDREIKLVVGGFICETLKNEKLHPNVELKGLYDNPTDFYDLGDIVINPVSEGTGLKIKTIEAVAHGKATIVDKHSLIGVYAPSQFSVMVASNAEEYVNHIITYLSNKEELLKIQHNCYSYVQMLNNYIEEQYLKAFL